jgi:hypothetical protein
VKGLSNPGASPAAAERWGLLRSAGACVRGVGGAVAAAAWHLGGNRIRTVHGEAEELVAHSLKEAVRLGAKVQVRWEALLCPPGCCGGCMGNPRSPPMCPHHTWQGGVKWVKHQAKKA